MPLKRCTENGVSGWKWGDAGKCYGGPDGRKKAIRQMVAEKENGAKGMEALAELMDYDYEFFDGDFSDFVEGLDGASTTMAYIAKKERDKIPATDFADEKNRKFPIRNQHDLDSAAKLIGRAPKDKQASIKARIKEIAKKKGLTLPASWSD